jgi:hypothetical protein
MKIMTNSGRYNMLAREMDVNAGRYLDGTPMETLGRETFALLVRLASGERSAGERVGYPQVQLWRDWPQTGPGHVEEVLRREKPTGKPLRMKPLSHAPRLPAVTREEVGLLLANEFVREPGRAGDRTTVERRLGGIGSLRRIAAHGRLRGGWGNFGADLFTHDGRLSGASARAARAGAGARLREDTQ